MSALCVELVVLRVKEGVDLFEGTGKTKFDRCVNDTNSRPGCHAHYVGMPEELPGTVYIIAEWESLDAHRGWQTHPDYPDFMSRSFEIFDREGFSVQQFYLVPNDPVTTRGSPFNAPVTEVSWIYYPESVNKEATQAKYDTYRAKAAQLTAVQGAQGGWVLEEAEAGGERAKLFIEFTGQASTAEHTDAAKKLGKESGAAIALLEGSLAKTTVHVAFKWQSSSQWQISQASRHEPVDKKPKYEDIWGTRM